MNIKRFAAVTVAAGVAVAALAPISAVQAETKTKVAYVFKENVDAKDSFKELLEENGFEFRGVRLANSVAFDYTDVDVVIVADDTSEGWEFSNQEFAEKIDALQKPVLAVGVGGSAALDLIAPDFGYSNSMQIKGSAVAVAAETDQVWSAPMSLAVSNEETVEIYKDTVRHQAIWGEAATEAVIPLADSEYPTTYHPLATGESADGQDVFLWGFFGNARRMTEAGQKLFTNAAVRIVTSR